MSVAHSFTSLNYHLIFSTKERRPLLTAEIRTRVFDYLGGIIRNKDGKSFRINGPADHVHALVSLPSKLAIADVLRDFKGDSTEWIKRTLGVHEFGWQTGYAAFSVSASNMAAVQKYIEDQEEHHRKMSFQEEYLAFLKKHEIEYDPRFVFD